MPVIVTSVPASRWLAAAGNALATALVAWLSLGTLALRAPAGHRLGILGLDASTMLLAALAGLTIFLCSRRAPGRVAIALTPLALVAIPWLPLPLPAALLIWTGAMASLIWLAVAAGVACALDITLPVPAAWAPRPAMLAAALGGLVVFSVSAWAMSAAVPGGDEPHYLVITQSLLYDHDLKIENNHARGDYHAYFAGPLEPDFRAHGKNGAIYSIHAPGVPALILPAFAIGGYRGAELFLIALAASACALAWWLAWRETGSLAAAWFGWAVVALSPPFLLESFTVYPDVPGAAAVLTGFWALRRAEWDRDRTTLTPWILHGAALAALPWMHTRFALLAAALGLLVIVRLAGSPRATAKTAAFLAVPIVSAAAWLAFFYVIYGTLNPAAPYGSESDSALAFLPDGLGGLLFDQGFGLIAMAPVLVVAFAGLARARRFAAPWLIVAIPYTLTVSSYAMWWAGTSGPARFMIPLILPLAIPAAVVWSRSAARISRAILLAALVATVWTSAVIVGAAGGGLGYHDRNRGGRTAAPWIMWANPLVNLAAAAPAYVPLPFGTGTEARVAAARTGWVATIPWLLCLAGAVAIVRRVGRPLGAEAGASLTTGALAVAIMIAATIDWSIAGAQPFTPLAAQMDALTRLARGRTVALDLSAGHVLSRDEAWKMRLITPVDAAPVVAEFSGVPAGAWTLVLRGAGAGTVSLVAGHPDDAFPLMTAPAADFARGVSVVLPVAVRQLILRGSAGGADQAELRAAKPAPAPSTLEVGERAERSAAYGPTRIFFLDDRTFPEMPGFWILGARDSVFEIDAGSGRSNQSLTLRNGAVDNVVSVETGAWRQQATLRPGAEQAIDVPLDAAGTARVRIHPSAGFRPAELDPKSQDRRFLGVFVVMPQAALR